MADPTVHVRRALAHLQQRTAMRAEIAMLRRELAAARGEVSALRLAVALAPYSRTATALPPLRHRIVRIPGPRVVPEGVRNAPRRPR